MQRDLTKLLQHTRKVNDCLIWTKCANSDGYPRALIDGDANAKVHRIVWEEASKQSASGFVVRHSCDNPMCINPEHLSLGSQKDNIVDRDKRQRHGASKLSHDAVRMIRHLNETTNMTQSALAQMFRVHVNTINSLLNRKHWKHVI